MNPQERQQQMELELAKIVKKRQQGKRLKTSELATLLAHAHNVIEKQARIIDELQAENKALHKGNSSSGLILPFGRPKPNSDPDPEPAA